MGSIQAYMPISLLLCLVVRVAFWQSFAQPVITHSACDRRQRVQNPWRGREPWIGLFSPSVVIHAQVSRFTAMRFMQNLEITTR